MTTAVIDTDSIDLYSVDSFASGHPVELYARLLR